MDRREHIGFELRLIQNLICESMKESHELDGVCVTQLQHWIIRYLDDHQEREIYQRDLEEAFHTSRATISNTLQVMERNGLITRTAVVQDARLKSLKLTEKSVEFTRRIAENVEQMERKLRKGMTDEEFAVFMETLRRIRRNLEEDRPERSRQWENKIAEGRTT